MGSLDTWTNHWGTDDDYDGPGADPDEGCEPADRPSSLPDNPPTLDPPEEDPNGDDIPPTRPQTGDVPAGGGCACDGDCRATGGHTPICIHGICGVRATDDRCPAASTESCPTDHRCWSGSGTGLCYPDFIADRCDGFRDSEGSCVTDGTLDCWAVCGDYCDIPGNPPGRDPDESPSDDDPTDELPDDDPPDDPPDEPLNVCEYPSSPHRLGLGSVIAPMRWSSAEAGSAESGTADLEEFFCDDSVRGVFIYSGTTWCTYCGELLRDIAAQSETWERNGIVWIFIVSDTTSASMSSSYIDRYGIDFGFRTNDSDNSEGGGAIVESGLFSTIPWVSVIRADDMIMIQDMASAEFDLAASAAELGL